MKTDIDWENVDSLTSRQQEKLRQAAYWGIGDFAPTETHPMAAWRQRYLDKLNESDYMDEDMQGYDDEEANERHGVR